MIDTPDADSDYYHVAYQAEWSSNGGKEGHECMPPYSVTIYKELFVDSTTGECFGEYINPEYDLSLR